MPKLLRRDPAALEEAIRRACAIKAAIVVEDEREQGRRALLNLGHTFGHAIEAGAGYGTVLHGEAVAAGLVLAAELSARTGRLPGADALRVRELLASAGLPVDPPRLGRARMQELMAMDKKVKGGQVRLVLLDGIGQAVVTADYPPEALAVAARGADGPMRRGRDPDAGLAPYAALERTSRGRRHPEPLADYRGEFQRDRDRIIHSNAFRRLVYKTQVFINHEGDMYRTRLTHSIEVAQIGRSVAGALFLSEPLTEAICLAHDLGHTPFGHAGQDVLNDCMREYGGFEHNLQSLRVVDELEERYAEFRGLNLCFETREGILKHCSLANARQLGDLGDPFHRAPAAGPRGPDLRISRTPSPTTITTWTTGCARGWSRSRSFAAWRCSRATTMPSSRATASCPGGAWCTRSSGA